MLYYSEKVSFVKNEWVKLSFPTIMFTVEGREVKTFCFMEEDGDSMLIAAFIYIFVVGDYFD